MARARCLCGDVVFEVDPPLQLVHDCHCRRCQKSHGTGSVTAAAVPRERFRWVRGEEKLARCASSPGLRRPFCPRCGSAMPYGGDFHGMLFFPLGALEGDFEAVSDGHIFASSRAPWDDLDDGLPAFDAYPPGVDLPALPDLSRPPAAPGRTGGSCLCGAVRWDYEGKPLLMRRCHCLRCRRARAHSHAANALVAAAAFHWTAGEDEVRLFKLPEAERFSQAFCGDCGGKVPWYVAVRDAWNVPLGGLDDDPGARPTEHIFVGSKAPWHTIHDDLPQHEEWPPG